MISHFFTAPSCIFEGGKNDDIDDTGFGNPGGDHCSFHLGTYIAPFCIIELIILALTSANVSAIEKRLDQLDTLVVKEKLY